MPNIRSDWSDKSQYKTTTKWIRSKTESARNAKVFNFPENSRAKLWHGRVLHHCQCNRIGISWHRRHRTSHNRIGVYVELSFDDHYDVRTSRFRHESRECVKKEEKWRSLNVRFGLLVYLLLYCYNMRSPMCRHIAWEHFNYCTAANAEYSVWKACKLKNSRAQCNNVEQRDKQRPQG